METEKQADNCVLSSAKADEGDGLQNSTESETPAIAPRSKVICVDFDGVIAQMVSSIDDFGEPIEGVQEALSELKDLGYRIIIYTARPSEEAHQQAIIDYLHTHQIPYDAINSDPEGPWIASKPLADLYIDDRALRFEGDWVRALRQAKILLGKQTACTPAYNALTYEELLDKVDVRIESVKSFDKFLRYETAWLTAPASTRFHLNCEGGLLTHSLNVANSILKLRPVLAPEISEESCVIVALYHDVGKVGMPGKPYYVPNPSKWHVRNRNITYITNHDLPWMDIATRSLFLVSQHVKLSADEGQAIRYHDGQYLPENGSVAHKETKLTRLLQYADNWAGCVLEKDVTK